MKNESMEIKTFWEKLRDRKKKKQTKHKLKEGLEKAIEDYFKEVIK